MGAAVTVLSCGKHHSHIGCDRPTGGRFRDGIGIIEDAVFSFAPLYPSPPIRISPPFMAPVYFHGGAGFGLRSLAVKMISPPLPVSELAVTSAIAAEVSCLAR